MALGGLGEYKNTKCSHKPRVRVLFFLRSPFGEIWARYLNDGKLWKWGPKVMATGAQSEKWQYLGLEGSKMTFDG